MEEPQEPQEPIEEPAAEEFSFYDIADADLALVSTQIEQKYDFTPSDEYVYDLVKFVKDMLYGEPDDPS